MFAFSTGVYKSFTEMEENVGNGFAECVEASGIGGNVIWTAQLCLRLFLSRGLLVSRQESSP